MISSMTETALLAMLLRTYTAELAQNLRTGNGPMPPPATIKEFWYHEFEVRLLKDGRSYLVIAWDRQNREVARTAGETLEDVEAEIRAELNARSADFIGLPGAINLFRRAFPDGFGSPFYEHYEGYKTDAAAFLKSELTQHLVKSEIDAGRHEVVATLARRAFSKSNLTSPYEQMALGNALKDRKNLPIFARGFFELLYGEFDAGLQRLATLLKPYNAAKWPILTYWPFFRFPDRHAFLKPEIAKTCAYRLGRDLDYDPTPNPRSYKSFLDLMAYMREGIQVLGPRDNIDLQTFMYVTGTEGYVAAAIEDRERWEASKNPSS
jgi:hypothetical protein